MHNQHGSFNPVSGPKLVRLDSGAFALRWGGTTHAQGTLGDIAWSVRPTGLYPLVRAAIDCDCLTAEEAVQFGRIAAQIAALPSWIGPYELESVAAIGYAAE